MDKENIPEPAGILKKISAEVEGNHRHLLPDRAFRIRKLSRRRVSFAPEVTLHKIDFIPQYRSDSYDADAIAGPRRETIAYIPSSQEREVDDFEYNNETRMLSESSDEEEDDSEGDKDLDPIKLDFSSNNEIKNFNQIPNPVLHYHQEQDQEQDQKQNQDVEDDDLAPIQKSIPLPLDDSFSRGSDHEGNPQVESDLENEMDSEEDMELTEPIDRKHTNQYSTFNAGTVVEVQSGEIKVHPTKEEMTEINSGAGTLEPIIESNTLVSTNLANSIFRPRSSPKLESADEVQKVDDLENVSESDLDLSLPISRESQMEVTELVGTIVQVPVEEAETEQEEMELTQTVGNVNEVSKISYHKDGNFETIKEDEKEQEEEEEEEDMEFTQQVGSVKAGEISHVHKDAETSHVHKDIEKDETMELTQHLGYVKTRQVPFAAKINSPRVPSLDAIPDLSIHNKDTENANQIIERKRLLESPIEMPRKSPKSSPYQANKIVYKLPETKELSATEKQTSGRESSVTSTVPLADVTNDSFDENEISFMENPVTLTQFLKDIGMKFYDDLDIGSQRPNRISINLSGLANEEYSVNEYTIGSIQIPTYELYEFSCNELTKNIQESIQVFEKLDKSTNELNPRLFKEFYSTIPEAQVGMRSQFQLIKDYARQEAKKVWYKWRIQLHDNLIEELQRIHNSLEADKEKTITSLAKINDARGILQEKQKQLKNKLLSLRILVENCKELKLEDIQKSQIEIVQLKQHIAQFKKECNQHSETLTGLNEEIHNKEVVMAKLNEQIHENKALLTSRKRYNSKEVRILELSFHLLESAANCKYVSLENETLTILYDEQVEVSITFSAEGKVCYSFSEENCKFKNKHLLSLAEQITKEIDPKRPVNEQFQLFKDIWRQCKQIDSCIYKILLKYPIQMETNDIQIKFLLRDLGCKLELFINLAWHSNSHYFTPHLKIKSKKMTTAIDSDKVIQILKKECNNNWLVGKLNSASWMEV